MTALRIGSLCTGYGGLDMAVKQVFGGELAWTSDIDPGACRIIAHHHPGIPNLGDLTTTDWHQVVDTFGRPHIVTGGYPCQPFSVAGNRKGTADERHIWPYIADALRVLRPRLAVFENVANHLRLGFDTVLADLARLRFDAQWCVASASEVGAPHQRKRLFLLAWPAADAADLGHERDWDTRGRGDGSSDGRLVAADAYGRGREGHAQCDGQPLEGQPEDQSGMDVDGSGFRRGVAADTEGVGRGEGRPESTRFAGRPGAASGSAPDWGSYGPAIRRWEAVTGRTAPWATDVRGRLAPVFVEWLMGLPAGHVTDVPGLSRNAQLKALGNGVVPQQAAAAIRLLHARAFPAAHPADTESEAA